jgi:hypothetical protein
VTFDEALAALLALVGERVAVHVMDAGETPHLVATFGGRLRAGYSTCDIAYSAVAGRHRLGMALL